jgi:hypothetical protein
MIIGEHSPVDNEGWRTPESSWMDLADEDDCQMYHINVVIHESDSSECCTSSPAVSS